MFSTLLLSACNRSSKKMEVKKVEKVELQKQVSHFLNSSDFTAFHSTSFAITTELKKSNAVEFKDIKLNEKEFFKFYIENNANAKIDSLHQILEEQTQAVLQLSKELLPDFSTYEVSYTMGRKMYETLLAEALQVKWHELNTEKGFNNVNGVINERIDCSKVNAENTSSLIVIAVSDLFLKNHKKEIDKSLVNNLIFDQMSCFKLYENRLICK